MKIVVIGTRGFPGIQGGVETHCEELYPRIAALGHDVTVIRRSPYVTDDNKLSTYKGVRLIDVYAPRKKSFEAIVHTFLAILKARMLSPDIVHIHAVGPAIMTPVARLLGLKVVMTNHGPDYHRQKWGWLARFVIKSGERMGTMFSNRVIVISKVIAGILKDNYGFDDSRLIFNGVNKPRKSESSEYIESIGLSGLPYIVALGRFVKEKGFHDLVEAYVRSGLSDRLKLVIAGDSDHEDSYSSELKKTARKNGAILTGFIKGEKLNQLMTNASLFVMPSYHEGLPIALLEAMSYGIDVLVSDIPANRLGVLCRNDFFPVGDVDALSEALKKKCEVKTDTRNYDLSPYDWDRIAVQTEALYRELCP